ncbi:hypothetical protein FRC06_003033 [Ceratobasidium sp. 370]|nr:hypothetical protein FRC06_003033 [Ceratobasidium sp. 370]
MGGKAWLYWSTPQCTILSSRNVKFPPKAPPPTEDETPELPTAPIKGETTPQTNSQTKSEPVTPQKPTVSSAIPSAPVKPTSPPPLQLAQTHLQCDLPVLKYDILHKHGKTVLPNTKQDVFGLYTSDKLPDNLHHATLATEHDIFQSIVAEDTTYNAMFEVGPAYMDQILVTMGSDSGDRPTYAEAMKGPDRESWREATGTEITQLWATGTFELQKLPIGMKAIKYGWVLNKKCNTEGIVVHYKGRLVAKGYSQVKGIDYELTFAPVLRLDAFRLLCALASVLDLDIHQMDVISAPLNSVLAEEIYMEHHLAITMVQTVSFVLLKPFMDSSNLLEFGTNTYMKPCSRLAIPITMQTPVSTFTIEKKNCLFWPSMSMISLFLPPKVISHMSRGNYQHYSTCVILANSITS